MFVLYNKTSKKYLYDTSICQDVFKYNRKSFKVIKRQNTSQVMIFSDIHNKALKNFKLSCLLIFTIKTKACYVLNFFICTIQLTVLFNSLRLKLFSILLIVFFVCYCFLFYFRLIITYKNISQTFQIIYILIITC